MLSENPAGYLQDMGVLAAAGTYQSLVLLDEPDEEILEGRAQTTRYQILYPAGALGALAWKSTVVIGGTLYSLIAAPKNLDDGKWQRADLEVTE
jgi:hypothetical protein